MTAPITYTETVLPELAFLISSLGADPATLNAAANFTSFFERDNVLAYGREVHNARTEAAASQDFPDSAAQLEAASQYIATSSTSFSVRGSSLPELTALYFVAPAGIAELAIIAAQTWVTIHASPAEPAQLLLRHIAPDAELVVFVRQKMPGTRSYLAIAGDHCAHSPDGDQWTSADDARDPRAAVIAFVG